MIYMNRRNTEYWLSKFFELHRNENLRVWQVSDCIKLQSQLKDDRVSYGPWYLSRMYLNPMSVIRWAANRGMVARKHELGYWEFVRATH